MEDGTIFAIVAMVIIAFYAVVMRLVKRRGYSPFLCLLNPIWALIIAFRGEDRGGRAVSKVVTYDSVNHSISIKKRGSLLKSAFSIEECHSVNLNYTPDQLVYNGVTVGGVTTGEFHVEQGGYSLQAGGFNGKYALWYKYARANGEEYEAGSVSYIILSDEDYKSAKQQRFGQDVPKELKKHYGFENKNVIAIPDSPYKKEWKRLLAWLTTNEESLTDSTKSQ